MVSATMPAIVSCLLIFSVGLVAAQECKPEDKVPYETPLKAEEFTPLLSLTVPESCGDFQLPELLVCQADVNIQEGCCDQTCKDLFKKVEIQCLADIAVLVCEQGFEQLIPILNNLSRRCDDEYEELKCPEGAGTVQLTAAATNTTGADNSTATEECTPPVESDEPFNATALLPLASLAVPESCGDFSATNLIQCQEEINIVEGCCADQCRDVFAQVSQKCVADLGHLICTAETGAEAFPLIQRLARRCDENFVELSCEELAERAAALSSPVAEDPFDLQDDEEIAAELDEVVSEPTDFFSNPNPEQTTTTTIASPSPETEQEEEGESFGFFGSSPVSAAPEEPTAAEPDNEVAEFDESCTPPVEADEPVDTGLLLPLAALVAPESCGNFTATSLIVCGDELNFVEGCCAKECSDIFDQISQDCVSDLGHLICKAETGDQVFPIIQRLARRCDADYIDLSCEQLAARAGETGVGSAEPPVDASEADAEECTAPEEVDSNVNVSQISSMLAEVDQKICPVLNTTEPFNCQEDITLKSGCCQSKCKSFLAEMDQACLDEISSTICQASSDDFFIFDRMAERCIDEHESQTCNDLLKDNGAGSPSFFGTILGVTFLVLMIFA